jgi:hypothetical protein
MEENAREDRAIGRRQRRLALWPASRARDAAIVTKVSGLWLPEASVFFNWQVLRRWRPGNGLKSVVVASQESMRLTILVELGAGLTIRVKGFKALLIGWRIL